MGNTNFLNQPQNWICFLSLTLPSPHHIIYVSHTQVYLIIIRRSLENYTRKKSLPTAQHTFFSYFSFSSHFFFVSFRFISLYLCPLTCNSYFTFSIIFLLSFPKTLKYTKLCPRECPIYMTSVTQKFVEDKKRQRRERCHKDETWWLLGFPHTFKRAYRVYQHHQISLITISCKCINCVTDKFLKKIFEFFSSL